MSKIDHCRIVSCRPERVTAVALQGAGQRSDEMHYFANLNELTNHLPKVVKDEADWLCAHMGAWLAHPEIGEAYLFEETDPADYVRDVCGRLGLHAILPVQDALACLSENALPEDRAYALKSQAMLYWLS